MPFIALDCEGPITLNDNAFELSEEFIPYGNKVFSVISKYDDFLADVVKRLNYKAGDTLKLIIPFFKSVGLTSKDMEEFSSKTLSLIDGAEQMIKDISREFPHTIPAFIISTSYDSYLRALSKKTGFMFDNIYCTRVNIDSYNVSSSEAMLLKELINEIASMDIPEWEEGIKGYSGLDDKNSKIIRRLDEIFWDIIAPMPIGRVFNEVNTVGGHEKANSLKDISKNLNMPLKDAIYAGDSITDVEAFQLLRSEGGISIAFNGNGYAVRNAEFAIASNDARLLHIIIKAFSTLGNAMLKDMLKEALNRTESHSATQETLQKILEGFIPNEGDYPCCISNIVKGSYLFLTTSQNMDIVIKISAEKRREVRGKKIASLG